MAETEPVALDIPLAYYEWAAGIERDVRVNDLTPHEIAALIARLASQPLASGDGLAGDDFRFHDDTPEGIVARAEHYATTEADPLAREIERILFRRAIRHELEGYTLNTSVEIAAAVRVVVEALRTPAAPVGESVLRGDTYA